MKVADGFELVAADGVTVRVWPPRHGQHVAQAWDGNRPAGPVAAHRERPVAVSMAVQEARETSFDLLMRTRR